MEVKFKTLCITIVSMFIVGVCLIFLGIAKGSELASFLSKPWGATSWSTSEELMDACTYVPIVVGLFLIVLAFVFSIVTFIKYVKVK